MQELKELTEDSLRLYQQENYQDCAALSHRILLIDAFNVTALSNLGNIAYLNQEYDKATGFYQRILDIDSQNAAALFNLANTNYLQKKHNQALTYLELYLKLSLPGVEAYSLRGNIYLEQENFKAALCDFEAAAKLDSSSFWIQNYLGQVHQKLGHFDTALSHAWSAVELSGGADSQHLNFAYTLYETVLEKGGNFIEDYRLKWLQKYGDNQLVFHAASSLVENSEIRRVAPQYVRAVFDVFAPGFEETLASLDYSVPQKIIHVLSQLSIREELQNSRILDAGCGTGLCGILLAKSYPDSLIYGVDLSAGMLRQAEKKKVYNQLVEDDLIHYLQSSAISYKVIIAADVFTYFGDLSEVFSSAYSALQKGGVFIFSASAAQPDSTPWHLHFSGRFLHTETYLKQELSSAGFRKVNLSPEVLRTEAGHAVKGWIITAQKPA